MAYQLIDNQIDRFFSTARERYRIHLAKDVIEQQKPWTNDPVFAAWRFCNVFREDDKVTKWIRDHVRNPLRNDPRVITAMAACRIYNRIETLEILHKAGCFWGWDSAKAREAMKGVRPIVGAAYVVKTPDYHDKLDGTLLMVDAIHRDALDVFTRLHAGGRLTLEKAWEALQRFPCIGQFMAYEIVSDLRHTYVLQDATDITTWACPGPGACRGLSWLVSEDLETIRYGGARNRRAAIDAMQRLLVLSRHECLWPGNWPRWEMREVEHWLCEFAKYVKVKYLGARMKRRYE